MKGIRFQTLSGLFLHNNRRGEKHLNPTISLVFHKTEGDNTWCTLDAIIVCQQKKNPRGLRSVPLFVFIGCMEN